MPWQQGKYQIRTFFMSWRPVLNNYKDTFSHTLRYLPVSQSLFPSLCVSLYLSPYTHIYIHTYIYIYICLFQRNGHTSLYTYLDISWAHISTHITSCLCWSDVSHFFTLTDIVESGRRCCCQVYWCLCPPLRAVRICRVASREGGSHSDFLLLSSLLWFEK